MTIVQDEIPAFGGDGNLAKSLLCSSSNGVNFFVEDTNREFEYEIIFERLLGKDIKINSVVACDGKEGVKNSIAEFSTEEYQTTNGICIFVVDGDFDNFFETKQSLDNLLYLKYYNIECYFIEEESTKYYLRKKLKKTMSEIDPMIDFDKWYNNFVIDFKKLFALYLLVKENAPDIPNVGTGPHRYLNSDGRIITTEYNMYYNTVKHLDTGNSLNNMITRIDDFCNSDYKKVICGKYMLESLRRYLVTKTNVQIGYDKFRECLLEVFDIQKLNYIKEEIFHYRNKFYSIT